MSRVPLHWLALAVWLPAAGCTTDIIVFGQGDDDDSPLGDDDDTGTADDDDTGLGDDDDTGGTDEMPAIFEIADLNLGWGVDCDGNWSLGVGFRLFYPPKDVERGTIHVTVDGELSTFPMWESPALDGRAPIEFHPSGWDQALTFVLEPAPYDIELWVDYPTEESNHLSGTASEGLAE